MTIRDVAKYANVSPATVSYVLNDVKKVSEETKKRVLEAVDELGYYPDFTAVSLSKRKSNLVGIMLPLVEDSPAAMLKNNQYYHEFLSGVEMVVRNRQFDTMITGVYQPEECRQWVKKRNLDGLIFLGMFPRRLYDEMTKLNIPIVLIDTYEEYTKQLNNVQIDDERGGYLAAKHLLDLGHRQVAFIATSLENSPVDTKRYQGFLKAFHEKGVAHDRAYIFETHDITFEQGLRIGKALIQQTDQLTGIATVSDVLAIGMMKAFQEHGKKVPDDYSIVGFDDLSMSQYVTPSLTTIRQDVFEKGKAAGHLLVNAIEQPDIENQTVELPVQLMTRQSTKTLV
ncbi:LacI family DNA-binding transcriptional regulator [Litoribacterium kuwaitense]|uniref:LacI family DNA-binding transcriptional regulator n=1 Tax=Litoribacterium kuwaitense TaxID=1398745 RepID=UPI001FE90E83|nr:LacI family DNA-binding transcriptional regulator [Litoribacterium kuwaitense]